jgi:hypothetical protein
MADAGLIDRRREAPSPEFASGALPNLIVVGAQKCGTSGLHFYLGHHPEIAMSSPKELNFFVVERNWSRGLDWYRGHFDPEAAVRGESSPNYTTYPHHLGIPERMHEAVPGAKLIFLVRDPLERFLAQNADSSAPPVAPASSCAQRNTSPVSVDTGNGSVLVDRLKRDSSDSGSQVDMSALMRSMNAQISASSSLR